MKSLESYLNSVYTDFETSIQGMNRMCDMSSLNYKTAELPDYTNIHIQQLYLLKYAYAYAYEYYLMYDKVVRELGIGYDDRLSVLSLGCGAMVDLMGLQSLQEKNLFFVNYTGVDKVDWKYKPCILPGNMVECKTDISVGTYFKNLSVLDSDVYMFPKSISEFSEEEIKTIADCFRSKMNNKKRFALCISLRNSDINRNIDLNKSVLLETAISESGYEPGTDNNSLYVAIRDCGIKKYEKDYNYPECAIETLRQLGDRCNMVRVCPKGAQCINTMNRYPVLKTREICYKVMTFERRN